MQKSHLVPVLFLSILSHSAVAQPVLLDPAVVSAPVTAPGLVQCINIAFLGPRDFLVGEKSTGRVRRVRHGVVTTVLDLPVQGGGERGLLGLVLHPDFAANGFVYIYYSRATGDGGSWIENRVARFTWNGAQLLDEQRIYGFPNDPNQPNGGNHNGGIIEFGPDGRLYVTTGDLNRSRLEQNRSATLVAGVGGIYRLNDDGSIPADNPFADHPADPIRALYCYGVRNSFGLHFDPQTGYLWMTDNGPGSWDEINLVQAGANLGWNRAQGPIQPGQEANLVLLKGAAYSDPEFSFRDTNAITALEFLAHSRFPCSYWSSLVAGDGQSGLHKFTLNENRDGFVLSGALADLVAENQTEALGVRWGSNFGTTGDLEIGPDGALYQTNLFANQIRRILPLRGLGDLNCDGVLNNFDLDPFVLALTDPAEHAAAFPECPYELADINCDGAVNNFDIQPFVGWLVAQ